jgi:hypothetical protein
LLGVKRLTREQRAIFVEWLNYWLELEIGPRKDEITDD